MTMQYLGFPSRYECEVLPGLPGSGTLPCQFHFEGQSTHSEGLVLKVTPDHGETWIGNFQRGDSGLSGAFGHPLDTSVIAIA